MKDLFRSKNKRRINEIEEDYRCLKILYEKRFWGVENEPKFKPNEKAIFINDDKECEVLILEKPFVVNVGFFEGNFMSIERATEYRFKYKVFLNNKIEEILENKLIKLNPIK